MPKNPKANTQHWGRAVVASASHASSVLAVGSYLRHRTTLQGPTQTPHWGTGLLAVGSKTPATEVLEPQSYSLKPKPQTTLNPLWDLGFRA